MSVQPAVGLGSLGTIQGTADIIADIRRQVSLLMGQRTLIGDSSITGTKIANETIVGGNLAIGTITTEYIAAGAIQAGNIAANSIQATHLQAGSVTAGKIAANAVVAGTIAAGAVQAGTLDVGAVTAGTIAANAVTATNIASINLSVIQAVVTTLSTITSNMGSITAGTIQGATIQTASSGSRVVINSSGLTGYASDGTTQVFNINTGTGIASFTGVATITGGSIIPSAIPTIGGGNLIPDSSFEDATNGSTVVSSNWALYNNLLSPAPALARVVLAGAKNGTAFARLTNSTDTTGDMGVVMAAGTTIETGKDYTLTAYGQPAASGGQFQVLIAWYTAADAFISSVAGTLVAGVSNIWTRASLTATAPATAAKARCYCSVNNPASGFVFYVDAMQLEEGKVATAYQPKITELLPGAIQTIHLAAGAVTANTIAAGAITAQKLSLSFGGANVLANAQFKYIPTVSTDPGWSTTTVNVAGDSFSPGYWFPYENVPAEATGRRYTVVTNGSPLGTYPSWKVIIPSGSVMNSPKGFMTQQPYTQEPSTWYTMSFWWKGNRDPGTTNNGNRNNITNIDWPSADPNTWQRYSQRYQMNALGGALQTATVFNGFEANLGGYAGFVNTGTQTLSRITAGTITGAGSAQLVATTSNSAWIYPGFLSDCLLVGATKPIKIAGDFNITSVSTSVANVEIRARCYTAAGALLNSISVPGGAGVQTSPTTGTLYHLEGVIDATALPATTAYVGVEIIATLGIIGNITYKADNFRVSEAPFVDYFYVYPSYVAGTQASTIDCQIAMPQWERGEYPTAHAPATDELLPYSVGNTVLAPDSITTDKILAATIQAGDIAAATITGGNIAANTVTASNISVSSLSALSANIGTVTAGTIRGPIFETSAANPKIRIDTTDGFFVADAGGVKIIQLPADASTAVFTGQLKARNIVIPYDSGTLDQKSVQWARAADGSIVGEITPTTGTGISVVGYGRSAISAGEYGEASIAAYEDTAANHPLAPDFSKVTVMAKGDGIADSFVSASTKAGAGSTELRIIIDNLGQSDFMQSVTRGNDKFEWKVTQVTMPATAAGAVGNVTITHGMGATPVAIFALVGSGATFVTGFGIETVSARTSTTFTLAIRNNTGAVQNAATMNIAWMGWIT